MTVDVEASATVMELTLAEADLAVHEVISAELIGSRRHWR
jgi:hypothetical protein